MTVLNKTKLLAKVGVVAALGWGLAIASQSAATAAPSVTGSQPAAVAAAPVISVTPSEGLADGTVVTVSGTDLQADGVYHVGQCAAVRVDAYACNPDTNNDVTADSSGASTTPLIVRSSFQGVTADGTIAAVDCLTVSCVVAVYNDAFEGGSVPLSFS